MQLTKFGRTGMSVSRLCLGTATFGRQTDEAEGPAFCHMGHRISDQRPLRAVRVVPIAGRPLPVYTDQRTSSDRPGMSGWCQKRSFRLSRLRQRTGFIRATLLSEGPQSAALRLIARLGRSTRKL
jgi:hypothetical protein